MKIFLFFILFLNSTFLLSQIKLVCEYNPEWKYDWYHNDISLGIKTNVLYSIGKNVSGNYKVFVLNDCDTTYQTINIKNPKDNNTYHLKNIDIDSCNQTYLFNQSEISFIIFPNPTKNLLNFRVYRENSALYQITIYDQLGKKIFEKKLNCEDQIDVTNISNGIYIFEVILEKTKNYQILIIY